MSYDTDFFAWTQEQAERLRARKSDLDFDHVAEEIESLGKRDRRELSSRLGILLQHALKWTNQPEHRSRSWRGTILEQIQQIEVLLEESPSLKSTVHSLLEREYPRARERALLETGLQFLPESCPFTFEELTRLPQSMS